MLCSLYTRVITVWSQLYDWCNYIIIVFWCNCIIVVPQVEHVQMHQALCFPVFVPLFLPHRERFSSSLLKFTPYSSSILKSTPKHSSQDLSFYLLESPGLSKLIPFSLETQRTVFFFGLPFVRASDSNTLVPCIVYSHFKVRSYDCMFFHLS